ncbi:hypothetical protein [Caminicella sporogenes]|nr:hypothetical protein [Caminicella sporogenes]
MKTTEKELFGDGFMEEQLVNNLQTVESHLQTIIDNQEKILNAISFESTCLIFLIVCFILAFIYKTVSNIIGDFY